MKVLLDTNILLRCAETKHSHHKMAIEALSSLRIAGAEFFLVPQLFYEYWVVSTRPVINDGRGITPLAVIDEFVYFQPPRYTILYDSEEVFHEWKSLVLNYEVRGKPAHDARLVAAMNVHKLSHLLTFNGNDFRRYMGITIIDPANPLALASPRLDSVPEPND